jgi:putative serine protease PepD
MFTETRRLARRRAAQVGLIVLAAVMVAGCASASTNQATSRNAAVVLANASTTQSTNVTGALPAASSTPATSVVAAGTSAVALQDQMVAVIKQVSPAVVEIQTDQGLGSGIIYDAKGDIVTNAHVVGTSTSFQVTLSNGSNYTGTLVGAYVPDDIAVIKISAPNLTVATFGDSSQLSVGDFVLAMGNPLGLQSSVTEGIVSAVGRQITEPDGYVLPDAIQTSAAINPGNSGGALVDLNGEVVGIPTLEATDSQVGGSAAGIGFAISSNRAKLIADQLIASGKVTNSGRAYMGVQLRDGTAGPVVVAVVAGGPADKAGIVVGDIVLSVDSTATPDSATLVQLIAAHKPGDTLKVKLQHQDGTTSTVSLTLAQLPS